MNRNRYQEIVQGFAGRKVVVLGDLMLDEYLWGSATRISPESPVMVVDVDRETSVPGGAANVVNNLLALGAHVAVIGVAGDDEAGRKLINALQDEGADVEGIVVDETRPTTRKTRVVAHSQQVLRVDREKSAPISHETAREIMQRLHDREDAEAVIVSDYNKGLMTPGVARSATALCGATGAVLTANPKPQNARHLSGAQVLQLNQAEAEATAAVLGLSPHGHDGPETFEEMGRALRKRLGVYNLLVTRGAKGLALFPHDGDPCFVAAHEVEVYDVAGAGDTVISCLTLGLIAGASLEEAATVANHAAACVVRKVGVATVTAEEILADW
jgi:D-glycero-beta-D-manno-heptose-7-phosphate kinase